MSDLMIGEKIYVIGKEIERETKRCLGYEYSLARVAKLVDPKEFGYDTVVVVEGVEIPCLASKLFKFEDDAKAEVERREAMRLQQEEDGEDCF